MPYKLLLADDSVTIQRVIELTFAEEDVQVTAVSDGDQAIARLDAEPPDIVLADIGMPGRDGYQVAEYIKANPRLAHIPVVLLTGAFEPVDQVRASSIGCDGVLAKPFEPQLVIGRVRELLARQGSAAPPVDANLTPPAQSPAATAEVPDGKSPAPTQSAGAESLGDYFDRLDAAFANLPGSSDAAVPTARPAESIDWFDTTPSVAPAVADRWDVAAAPSLDPPLSSGSPRGPFDRPPAPAPAGVAPSLAAVPFISAPPTIPAPPEVASMLPPPPPAPPVTAADSEPPRRPQVPALADAFAALLTAERSVATAQAPAGWPAGSGSAPVVTDDLVDEVARRVAERLSDRVVRELVSEMISAVAERLVREEIERIKASIV